MESWTRANSVSSGVSGGLESTAIDNGGGGLGEGMEYCEGMSCWFGYRVRLAGEIVYSVYCNACT